MNPTPFAFDMPINSLMTRIVSATIGPGRLTKDGEAQIAASMYAKGKAFVGSALLLRQHGGNEYVALHLLCQGTELILKAILLALDYRKFERRLRRIGHNLVAAADAVAEAANLKPAAGHTRAELDGLSKLYAQHLLRYGFSHDIFIRAATIPSVLVLRGTGSVIKWAESRALFQPLVI